MNPDFHWGSGFFIYIDMNFKEKRRISIKNQHFLLKNTKKMQKSIKKV